MANSNILKPILLVGGAIVLLTALQASRFIKNLRLQFTKLSMGGTVTNPRVYATIKIYNPTNFSVTISDLRGALYYNNKFVANVQTIGTEKIEAFENVFFDLELISTLPQAVELVKNFLSKKISNGFYFDGTLKINDTLVPWKGNLQV